MYVLYVEDDPCDADLTRRALAKRAPQVRLDTVATQQEALARLEGEPSYDVLLADLHLPDGDGLSLLAHVRERALPLAVVIVTGRGDEEAAVAALKAGADDYVVKREGYLVRLPLVLEDALHRLRAQTARHAHPLRVLYAEPSVTDIDLTRRHMARYAPHVHLDTVCNAAEVLQRLPIAERYDLLLLDYRLPGVDALELIKELRQEHELDLPVVLVTGHGNEEVVLQTLRLGAADYVVKSPGYLHRLPSVLENALHRAQVAREQAALQESEARMRSIIEQSSDGISVTDEQGRIVTWNRSLERITGLKAEEMIGKAIWDSQFQMIPGESRAAHASEPLKATLLECLRTGQVPGQGKPLEREYTRPDGTRVFVQVSVFPIRTEKGFMLGSIIRDATERARAETEIRQKTEDLALLYALNRAVNRGDSTRQVIDLLCRETTRIFFCSGATVYLLSEDQEHLVIQNLTLPQAVVDRVERLAGIQISGLRIPLIAGGWYQNVLQAGKPRMTHDPAVIQAMMAECTTNKTLKKIVPRIYKMLGSRSVISVPLVSEGKAIGLLDMSRPEPFTDSDLARFDAFAEQVVALLKHRRAADGLERVSRQNDLILNAAGEGIYGLDAQGRFTFVNPAAARMLGWALEEIEDQLAHATIHHSRADGTPFPREACPICATLQDGVTHHVTDEVFWRKDGASFPVEYTSTPIREGGKLVGAVVTFNDVAERVQAEEALRTSLEETARSNRLLLTLSQAAQDVQRARTPDEVYRIIGDAVAGLGYNAMVLAVTDDRAHLAVSYLAVNPGLVQAAEKLTGLSAEGYRFRLAPGEFFQQIMDTGETTLAELGVKLFAEALPRPVRPLAGRLESLMGWAQSIVAPLIVGGEAHALLIITGSGLSEAEVPAITVFANQAAIAIENARLYQETDRLREFNEDIVQGVQESILLEDADWIITFVNPKATELLGYTAQELIGRHRKDLIAPEEWLKVKKESARRPQGITGRYETTMLTGRGERVPVLVSARPLFDGRRFSGTLVVLTDISDRVQAEKALRESEDRYRDLVEHSQDLINTHDLEGRILSTNEAASSLLGYSQSELLGKNIRDILMPEYRDEFDTYLAKLQTHGAARGLMSILTATGERRIWEYRNSLRTEGVTVPLVRSMARDVTERVRAQQRQAAIHTLGQRLIRSRDVAEIAYSVVNAARQVLRFPICGLWLVDEEQNSLVCWARTTGPEAAEMPPLSLDDEQGITVAVARSGESVYRPDVIRDPRYVAGGSPARSELCVPLRVGDRVVGVLNAESERLDAFSVDDAQLMEALASVAAIALDNARLFQAEHEQREMAEALREAARAMGASLDLVEILRLLLDQLQRVLVCDSSSVLVLREGGAPNLVVGQGYAEEGRTVREAGQSLQDSPILRQMARDLQPVVSADVRQLEGWTWVPGAEHVRAWLGIPLVAQGRMIGALMLDHAQPGFFGQAEVQVAGALAQHAAQTIENARLYDEARRRGQELALLNRVIAASAAGLDVESILETTCRELARAFDVPQAAATLFDEGKTRAVVVAEYLAKGCSPSLGEIIPAVGNPAFQHLLEHKTPLAIENAQTDPRLAPIHDLMRRRGTVSLLLLPLIIEGEVIGSLGVDAIEHRPFTAEEVDLAQRVAEQVSGALARARLEETQQRLSAAIEQAAETVIITDTEDVILYVNPAFERITGYSRAEVLGRTPRLLSSGKQDASFYRALWETISAGQVWQGQFVNRRKDGSLFTEEATIAPVRNRAGEIVNYVSVKRDVTREVELEEQFRQAQKMEAIGQLAGGVAHDFNNLLTVIHLSTRLLERRLHPQDPLWAHVERIQDAGQRATQLTRQLLSFSRKEVIEPQVLDLNQVIGELSKMLQRMIREDVELALDLAEDLWMVYLDPTQVDQVIVNLVVNARDAMPEGGTLTIETANVVLDEAYTALHVGAQPGQHVQLTVSDTGVGMTDEVRAHLFEPFFTTKERGEGTGLGLATVYGIVQQNQGHIGVYSEVGLGTTFKIYLPCAEQTVAPRQAPDRGLGEDAPRGTETILVVEDAADVREITVSILEDQGYRVLVAANGPEALVVCQGHDGPIHLLLTDVVMPGMSGRDLAEQVLARRPDVRVLYASGYTDETISHHGVLDPGVALLRKPFTLQSLTEKVRAVLDRPQ